MSDIDQKIAELKYNPAEVLAFKGEKIESFKKAEGKNNDGKYIVITREKINISSQNVDIGIVDAMTDLTYPGAVVLADTDLVENRPSLISAKRSAVDFVIDLPGMEQDAIFNITDPKYGNIRSAIDEKFNMWAKNYADTHSIVARSFYNESMIASEMQMLVKFGFGIKQAEKELSIDFSAVRERKSSVFIASFRQIFYTVSMSGLPSRPSELFADDVNWDALERQGAGNNAPPALVYKVAYGRNIFVKLETNHSSNEVESAFKAVMKDVSASANARYKDILDNTTFTAVVLGGGVNGQNEIISSKDISKINQVIAKYSMCNTSNPGYPVSYSTVFLKDNKVAVVNSSTDYIQTTYTEYQNADITLKHTGGYVAQFRVEWDDVNYDDNGNKTVQRCGWDGNSKDRTAPFSTNISLQGNAENVCVFAKECTGLAWEWWRTVFDKKNIPLVRSRTFEIYGTTLNQKYKITPDA